MEKESAIPDKEKLIKKWASGITTRNNRIKFTLRIQNHTDPAQFKAILADWEKEANSYIDFDNIESSKVFSAGWLLFAHPRYLNRDNLREWLTTQSDDNTIGNQFKHHSRAIYSADKEESKKTQTTAICITGPLDHVDEFMEFLYNVEWCGKYDGISFIPFQLDDTFSESDLRTAIRHHNKYLREHEKEALTIKDPATSFKSHDGTSSTALWVVL